MPTPYLHNELFEPNDILDVDIYDTNSGKVVVVDNFYKRPDDIHWMLSDTWVEDWKRSDTSRNFKDYYDCRLTIEQNRNFDSKAQKQIWGIIEQTFDDFKLITRDEPLRFNLFKWINTPSSNIQQYPHMDSQTKFAGIVYLDKFSQGGTAIYDIDNIEIDYVEDDDIRVDIDPFNYDVIPAEYNRLVLYPGWYMHGGFMTNHKTYTDNWRMNQVFFWDVNR
jgi:hypothetical protein